MLWASALRDHVEGIWGCNFAYAADGRISSPKNVVSFTDKTRYLFGIHKGIVGPKATKKGKS